MNKEDFIKSGILEQYVLGLTTEEENNIVENYSENYPEIKAEIERMQKAMSSYMNTQDIPFPPRVESQIQPPPSVPNPITKLRPSFLILLSSIVVLVVVSALSYQRATDFKTKRAELVSAFTECRQQNDRLQEELVPLQNLKALLQEPDTRTIKLYNTDKARVNALIHHNERLAKSYLQVLELPDAPTHHHYVVWTATCNEVKQVCAFRNPDYEQVISMLSVKKSEWFNITLEKETYPSQPDSLSFVANSINPLLNME